MASTNALQWNPTAANQEPDATYLTDAQRLSGATNPSEFDALLANKLFYQVSTYITALGTMLANKGINNSDANLATLTAAMANIITTADIRGNLQSVSYASTILLNASAYLGFQIALSGNVSSFSISGQQPGDIIVLVFVQDGTGGRTVAFSGSFVGAVQPDPTASVVSVQAFKVNAASVLEPMGPNISVNGINATAIGTKIAAAGAFTTLSASSSATAPTVSESDSSTHVATTAWVRGAFITGSSGGVSWRKSPDGYIEQWANSVSLGGGDYTANFVGGTPAFTTTPNIQISCQYPSGDTGWLTFNTPSATGFIIHQNDITGMSADWKASGY